MQADQLVARLRQAIDEDEHIARGAARRSGGPDAPPFVSADGSWFPVGLQSRYDARVDDHIARHDPARVLRQVAAHRKILDRYEAMVAGVEAAAGTILAGASKVRLGAYKNVIFDLADIYGVRDSTGEEVDHG